jgi:hypothetical protein
MLHQQKCKSLCGEKNSGISVISVTVELSLLFFKFMWPCIVTNFFIIKPTEALISQIYFCQETLPVSGSSSVHHQEFSTVHSALVYVMQVSWQLSNLHDTYQCRMYSGKLTEKQYIYIVLFHGPVSPTFFSLNKPPSQKLTYLLILTYLLHGAESFLRSQPVLS